MTEFLKVWVPAVSMFVGALSLFLAAVSLLVGLARGRYELAVKLIYDWAKDLDWASDRSINLAKDLENDVIKQIAEKKGVSIPSMHYDCVISVLRGEFSEKNLPAKPNNSVTAFQISPEHSAFIYSLWIRWLNRLEGTLAAWLQGVANIDLMEREFGPLVKKELEVLAIVRNGLPIIATFYKALKETGELPMYRQLGIFPWPLTSRRRQRRLNQ